MQFKNLPYRTLSPLLLLIFFSCVGYALFYSPPQSKRSSPEEIKPSVEVITTTPQSHDVYIAAFGLITTANKELSLFPQVSGVIINTHKNFIAGGFIPAEEPIIQIDTTDFTIEQREAQASLTLAQALLAIEEGKQQLAKRELELSNNSLQDNGNNIALALRVPQLNIALANVELAKSAAEKAKVNLQRTRLRLPYNARVLSVSSANGSLVGSQTRIATLIQADKRWLELKFPSKYLHRLTTRTTQHKGAFVSFSLNDRIYHGEVISLRADLVDSTKMSGAIVEVINLTNSENHKLIQQLPIGTHISANINAGSINDAYAIPREAYINNSHVFVVDDKQLLQKRNAELKWQLNDKVIIAVTLKPHDKIVTSQVFGLAIGTEVNPIEHTLNQQGAANAS